MPKKDANVEGYTIEGLIGDGPLGELWLAREDSTGQSVTLRRVDTESQTQERARRLLGTLETIQHPSLLRVREMVPIDDDMVVVSDYAEGGTLDELLRARQSLDPGEVVSFAAPISQALAAAHRLGLAHGAVSPDAIWFTAGGQPLLASLGLFGLLHPDDPPQPSDDIFAMAAICYTALTGLRPGPGERRRPIYMVSPGAPPGLAHVIEAGLQVQPQLRPEARELADQLTGSTPKVPVRLVPGHRREPTAPPPEKPASSVEPWQSPAQSARNEAGHDPRVDTGSHRPIGGGPGHSGHPGHPGHPGPPGRPGHLGHSGFDDNDDDDERGSRDPRTTLILSGVGLLVAIALAVTGTWWFTRDTTEPIAHQTTPPATSTPTKPAGSSTSSQNPDDVRRWRTVLQRLDTRRAQAFAALDVQKLDTVDAKDSQAYREDKSQIELLRKAGYTKAFRVERSYPTVRVLDDSKPDRAVLEVVVQPRAAVLEAGKGERRNCGTNASQKVAMVLTRSDGGQWLIQVRSIRDGTKRHPVCPPPGQPES